MKGKKLSWRTGGGNITTPKAASRHSKCSGASGKPERQNERRELEQAQASRDAETDAEVTGMT